MKIALLPGGFKPPHLGHYNMAKYLADFADKVIVRIGRKERDGIGPELALELFNYYKAADPDPRAQKLIISVASHPSPVKDVYDFIEQTAPKGSHVILGMGEKDAQDGRYDRIPAFAEPRNIKAEIELVPPQAGGISGTRMREIIKANDKAEFFKYIPDYLPEEIKEEIWTKLVDTTMPSEVEERITFQPDIDVQDIEFLDAQADADMDPVDIDLTSQHFFDRLNDPRNYPNIELDELELFFAKLADKKEEFIEFLNQYKTVVAKDRQTDINIPFMKLANKAIAKTIMRKRNFQTPDPVLPLEEFMGGTMNKQEMEKHNANMKKLRKVLSKINSQGSMVPVPSKLTKGLRRKLYEKVGIQRGTIESEVQFLSREIFELFKQNIGKQYETGGFEGWIEGSEYIVEYEIETLRFIPSNKEKTYDFDAYTEDDEIVITITYNPAVFPEEYNNLNAELKETLRHEIEHITQFGFDYKNYVDTYKGNAKFYKYLTLTHEIPAFVNGLHKRAKFKKISLNQAFDEFFNEYSKRFENEAEIEHVRQTWINWAQENLPKAKMKENFPPYKANQVQQTRYKASDVFTNDRKKAKKLGYVEEYITPADETKVDPKELKMGIEVEMEHTNDPSEAKVIALQHLAEDPKYYTKLATLGLEEMKLFSKEWWSDIITEELLNEGGAAGHMAHPFDLPNVNTGKDLIKVFEQAANSLKKTPGSVKIDGVNASIRLIREGEKRQFALDRGSKKELDIKGITKNDLEARFGSGHGMVKAGGDVLDIFNTALPTIQEELNALGLWNDPNIMFNMEYVSGKSNVQDYGKNFLAIHGLLKIETKEVQGARQMLTKRITSEKNYDPADMEELLRKLEPFAKKKGFEIYGSVPTVFKKDPDFKSVLNKPYKIEFSGKAETKTLGQWLAQVDNIPKDDRLKMNLETGGTKDVGALSKQVYFAVFGGETVDDLFDNEQEIQTAVKGATTYLATEKLGDAILDVLDSPMGSVNDHEGVVIRDEKISPRPFKITGKFITGGVSSQFQIK